MAEKDAGAKPYWTLYAMLQNFLSIMKTMGRDWKLLGRESHGQ